MRLSILTLYRVSCRTDNPPTSFLPTRRLARRLTSAVSAIAREATQTPPQIWVSEIAICVKSSLQASFHNHGSAESGCCAAARAAEHTAQK